MPCSNGFGHLNRCFQISKYLYKDFDIEFFCDNSQFNKFVKIYSLKNKIKNFHIPSNILKPVGSIKQLNKIKFIKKYINTNDILIVDSLIEALPFSNNSILLSNFFWHKIKKTENKIKINAEKILNKYNPTILGSSIFTQDHVRKQKNFYEYGLFKNFKKKTRSFDAILISCGGTLSAKKIFKENRSIIFSIAKNYKKIYVEKNIYDDFKNLRDDIHIADFSNLMYEKIDFAIIRPGIGTSTELISRKIFFLMLAEKSNLEMKFNSNILHKEGLAKFLIESQNFGSILKNPNNNLKLKGLNTIKTHIKNLT